MRPIIWHRAARRISLPPPLPPPPLALNHKFNNWSVRRSLSLAHLFSCVKDKIRAEQERGEKPAQKIVVISAAVAVTQLELLGWRRKLNHDTGRRANAAAFSSRAPPCRFDEDAQSPRVCRCLYFSLKSIFSSLKQSANLFCNFPR